MEADHRFKREVLGVAALLFLASLVIVYPFLDALLFAVATSYILRYLHGWINGKIHNNLISTGIIISGVLGIVSIGIYAFISNFSEILLAVNSAQGSLNSVALSFIDFLGLSSSFSQQILDFIDTLTVAVREEIIATFAEIPSVMVHLGVFSVTSIYLYKDGEKIEETIMDIVEGLPKEERRIAESLIDSTKYIFKGVFVTQFLVAISMGVLAWLGFYLIGLLTSPMPLAPVWAILIVFTALLPLVANIMVYAPVGTYYLISGAPVKGTLIIGFGVTVLQIMPEIFLRPYIGSWKMDEHPLVIFIGFLLGPLTLGLKGLILGPVILIMTKEFILDSSRLFS